MKGESTVSRMVVIGGGIAGLVLAASLGEGRALTIYQEPREASGSGEGTALALAPNAMRVLRNLGIADRVAAFGTQILEYQILNHRGQLLQRVDLARLTKRWGEGFWCVSRSRLMAALALTVNAGRSLNSTEKLVAIHPMGAGYALRFSDNSTHFADYVVAADGIHSLVRRSLGPVAEELQYQGYFAFRGMARISHLGSKPSSAFQIWGQGREFGYARMNADYVYWYATWPSRSPEAILLPARKWLQETFADWPESVGRLLDATSDRDVVVHPIYDLRQPALYLTGAYTLIGDAAHPMTPNLGQGACQAMVDGWVLGSYLRRQSSLSAFRRYEEERRLHVAQVMHWSRQMGRAIHVRSRWQACSRNLVLSRTPHWMMQAVVGRTLGRPESLGSLRPEHASAGK